MLNGQIALVTGASRGIGAAIAEELARQGADIAVIFAGSADKAAAVCAHLTESYGVRAEAFQCDAADFNAVKDTVAAVKKSFGTVNILVNNAGINRDGLLALMKESSFDEVIATNLKGTFNFIRHCTPLFLRNKGGRIINISSASGIMGNAGQANYSASKAGIIGLTKATARELAPKNITCNAVAPGFVQTDMTAEFDESNPLVASIPLGRMGTPADVANAVAFLASDAASYITGEVLRVDGGIAM